MIKRTPHYYKDFVCIASECKDNCCLGGWEINIDPETVEYYKQVPGEFGDKLRSSIDFTDEYCFKLRDGKCPFLDEKNLCGIYKELGPNHLGIVCDQFPRFSEYYSVIKETGIGIACEEAARIILTDNEAFGLCQDEIDEEITEDSEYDKRLGEAIFALRQHIFSVMDNGDYSLREKLSVILNVFSDVQELINENDYEAIDKLCKDFLIDDYVEDFEGLEELSSEELCDNVENVWYAYLEMDILKDSWVNYREEVLDKLHSEDGEDKDLYREKLDEFNEYCIDNNLIQGYVNLIKYYIFRYMAKASFDHDLLGKARLIVCNYLMLRDLDLYSYEMKGELAFEDRMENLHVFSREVEYSLENINILYEEFLFGDVFEPESLMQLI